MTTWRAWMIQVLLWALHQLGWTPPTDPLDPPITLPEPPNPLPPRLVRMKAIYDRFKAEDGNPLTLKQRVMRQLTRDYPDAPKGELAQFYKRVIRL